MPKISCKMLPLCEKVEVLNKEKIIVEVAKIYGMSDSSLYKIAYFMN